MTETLRVQAALNPTTEGVDQQAKLALIAERAQLYDEIKQQVTALTADYTLAVNDTVCHVDASSAAVTISLPPAADVDEYIYTFVRTNDTANTVSIDPDGTEQIASGGAGTAYVLPGGTYDSVSLQSDGTGWWVVNRSFVAAPIAYGHMYTNSLFTVAIASDETPTEVNTGGTDFTTGVLKNVTFSDHYLAVTYAGTYFIEWSMSVTLDSGSTAVGAYGGVMIDGSAKAEGRGRRTLSDSTESYHFSSTCILALSASDQVSLYLENLSDSQDLEVKTANVSLLRVE